MNTRVILLDGPMYSVMKTREIPMMKGLPPEKHYLAVAVANADCPVAVKTAHKDYLAAGARVITTCNYGVTRHHLDKIGQGDRVEELTRAAACCAREAIQEAGVQGQIAGCMPPLRESYEVENVLLEDQKAEYDLIAKTLAPHVDLLLCETMSSTAQAAMAAESARCTGLPVWVSFSLEDSSDAVLRSKEPLADALHIVASGGRVDAFLLNCCSAKAITAAMPILGTFAKDGAPMIGAYANAYHLTTSEWLSGQTKPEFNTADKYGEDGMILPEAYCQIAEDWIGFGAQIIGSCCGSNPGHIRALYDLFKIM